MLIIMLIIGLALVAGVIAYLVRRVHRFGVFERMAERRPVLSWLLAAGCVAALGLFALVNLTTMLVIVLHVAVGFALCDLAGWIVRLASGRRVSADARGFAALALTALYLGVGVFQAFHVTETHYTLTSDKLREDLCIVEIADSHLGITLGGKRFAAQMERVQAAKPDAVVLVGDFVDDDTTKKDMLEACAALGALKTTHGVFFVYGNHDNGYFDYRNFTSAELRAALETNGVTILEDQIACVDDAFYLVGRRDRSMDGRLDAAALTESLDPARYTVFLDHQPNDYAAEAAAGADLVLSGHTHGGHIFPAGQLGLLLGANDRRYGMETRGDTTFIVTSGISGWAIPIKTGTHSEIVVVDILAAS